MSAASATQASSSLHFGYLSQNSLWNPFTFLKFTTSLFLAGPSSVLFCLAEKRLWFWRLWVQWVFVPVHVAPNYERNSISTTQMVVFQEAIDFMGCVGIILMYHISLQPTQHFPPDCPGLWNLFPPPEPLWVSSCHDCFSAPFHPLLFQWRTTWASPALAFNPVLHLVGWGLSGCRPAGPGSRERQVTIDDLLLFVAVWRALPPLNIWPSLQRVYCTWSKAVTNGHGWNCLPKKFLAFPFPLTASGRILISSLVSTWGFSEEGDWDKKSVM